MNKHQSENPKDLDDIYQRQKIHIEELIIEDDLDDYQKNFKAFLSQYGKIIDIKILKNRRLKRKPKILWFCHF